MERMKAFVISLARETERARKSAEECRICGLDFEMIEAVDARSYKDPQGTVQWDKLHRDHPFTNEEWGCRFKASEIAIYASHLRAYRALVDQDLSHAFVFEDDWVLTGQSRFGLWEVSDALQTLPDWHHVMLHHEHLHINSGYRVIGQPHPLFFQVRQTPLIGVAYAISRRFAEYFLRHYSFISSPHDHKICEISANPHLTFLQTTEPVCASSGAASTQE